MEPLVVAEVETLLLQLPLQVPVSLGNKEKVRMRFLSGGDYVAPVLGFRPRPCTAAPRAFEDCVQQQHRHVAANAIALAGNTGKRFNRGPAKPGLKRIQLQHILPRRKVGVSSAGADCSLYLNVGLGLIPGVVSIPPYEVLRTLDDPGM